MIKNKIKNKSYQNKTQNLICIGFLSVDERIIQLVLMVSFVKAHVQFFSPILLLEKSSLSQGVVTCISGSERFYVNFFVLGETR